MRVERVEVAKINPAAYNPRKDLQPGDTEYEKLKTSIERFGFVEPLVWNERSGNLVGGHQRFKILKARGDNEVEVSVVDLSDAEERALNLALNKIEGDWDEEKLTALLAELESQGFDLSLAGFSEGEIDNLLSDLERQAGDDDVPEPGAEPITKPSDVWMLGRHRLMCGDSTRPEDVNTLLAGEKVQLIVSSPPYNVGKEYEDHDDQQSREEYLSFIRALLANCKEVLEQGRFICWNISHVPGFDVPAHHSLIMENLGFQFVDSIVWEKPDAVSPRFGVTMQNPYPTYYRPNHTCEKVLVYAGEEVSLDCMYGYETLLVETNGEVKHLPKKGSHRILRLAKQFRGIVWRFSGQGSKDHPAPFPVQLPTNCMQFYSREGERVFDPCGGSGTTLVAAEQCGRQAYLMELSPAYCDVIVRRFEKLTGEKAERQSSST